MVESEGRCARATASSHSKARSQGGSDLSADDHPLSLNRACIYTLGRRRPRVLCFLAGPGNCSACDARLKRQDVSGLCAAKTKSLSRSSQFAHLSVSFPLDTGPRYICSFDRALRPQSSALVPQAAVSAVRLGLRLGMAAGSGRSVGVPFGDGGWPSLLASAGQTIVAGTIAPALPVIVDPLKS
jgi:hypothetical protein